MHKKHVMIIGGTRGLGKTVTELFNKANYQLSVLGRSEVQSANAEVSYFRADLANEEQFLATLSQAIKQHGKIQHVIFLQRFKGEGDRWLGELEVSLNITRKIIDFVKNDFDTEGTVASITVVSSVMGNLANNSQPLSYSIAKAGLNHLVKYYAAELGPLGIRVNAVSPITFIKEESRKFYLEEKTEINALYQEIVPLKRMCTTEDVANVIHFLCSPMASFISGQNIQVDGGLSVVSHETLARAVKGL